MVNYKVLSPGKKNQSYAPTTQTKENAAAMIRDQYMLKRHIDQVNTPTKEPSQCSPGKKNGKNHTPLILNPHVMEIEEGNADEAKAVVTPRKKKNRERNELRKNN